MYFFLFIYNTACCFSQNSSFARLQELQNWSWGQESGILLNPREKELCQWCFCYQMKNVVPSIHSITQKGSTHFLLLMIEHSTPPLLLPWRQYRSVVHLKCQHVEITIMPIITQTCIFKICSSVWLTHLTASMELAHCLCFFWEPHQRFQCWCCLVRNLKVSQYWWDLFSVKLCRSLGLGWVLYQRLVLLNKTRVHIVVSWQYGVFVVFLIKYPANGLRNKVPYITCIEWNEDTPSLASCCQAFCFSTDRWQHRLTLSSNVNYGSRSFRQEVVFIWPSSIFMLT